MQENRQEKSQIKQKILLYLAKLGVSDYEFYKKSGTTRGILTQNNGISEENLARFLAYAPDVNLEWLLTGRGEMLKTEDSSGGTPPGHHPSLSYKDSDESRIAQENEVGISLTGEGSVGGQEDVESLKREIALLKGEIQRLRELKSQTADAKALEVSMKFFDAAKEMFTYYKQLKDE